VRTETVIYMLVLSVLVN